MLTFIFNSTPGTELIMAMKFSKAKWIYCVNNENSSLGLKASSASLREIYCEAGDIDYSLLCIEYSSHCRTGMIDKLTECCLKQFGLSGRTAMAVKN